MIRLYRYPLEFFRHLKSEAQLIDISFDIDKDTVYYIVRRRSAQQNESIEVNSRIVLDGLRIEGVRLADVQFNGGREWYTLEPTPERE
jgi:hypothetical protein